MKTIFPLFLQHNNLLWENTSGAGTGKNEPSVYKPEKWHTGFFRLNACRNWVQVRSGFGQFAAGRAMDQPAAGRYAKSTNKRIN